MCFDTGEKTYFHIKEVTFRCQYNKKIDRKFEVHMSAHNFIHFKNNNIEVH